MDKWNGAANACLKNGEQLLDDADWLCIAERPGSAFALAVIAQEEFAKAFLFHLIGEGILPAIPLVLRMAKDHTCKQLLGLVMEHIHPDTDEFLRRMDEWQKKRAEHSSLLGTLQNTESEDQRREIWNRINEVNKSINAFPAAVADAIDILRWEKVGRWQSKAWIWAEEPEYDALAKGVAEGSIDREKQDGLYVRIGRDGSVVTTPTSVRPEAAQEALERARRFGQLARQLLADDTGGLLDYGRIKEALNALFVSLKTQPEDMKSPTS
jgi:AbiV family abortive infection protein